MRTDSVALWLSSGKPVTSVAIAQLWERGRLTLEDPVARFIPEFAHGGKDSITIAQLLNHTGGLRTADKCDLGHDWDEIIDCVCGSPLEANWRPGQQAGYHPSGSWYVLGEVIRRITGQSCEAYVHDEVFERCGMRDCWMALPPAQFRSYGDRLILMYHTEGPVPVPHGKWNREGDAAVCRPGRNLRGPTRELGRFYERLLAGRSPSLPDVARPVLQPETIRVLTTRQRLGLFDDTFQQVIDWGYGFAIDSKRYGRPLVSYGFGRFASDQAFGHGGAQSSCAFADPAHNVVVAWSVNGLPGEKRHQQRAHETNSAIYEDLNLA
jgi:CubicO group peptidase (beta-lactamase class C family)